MQNVEEALLIMATTPGLFVVDLKDERTGASVAKDAWASNFVINVAAYVSQAKPLSTEQSRIILKLLARCRDYLLTKGNSALVVDDLLANPRYRIPPYQSSNMPREVRYLGDNLLGFRFKRNEVLVADIKGLHRNSVFEHCKPWFHGEYRIWVVAVTRQNLNAVQDLIAKHRFDFDDEVVGYLTLAANAKDQESSFVMDPELGVVAGLICDNELLSWWAQNVVGGEVL